MEIKEGKNTKNKLWYKESRRRNLVDMHIEDWNESFLSRFDPKKYVKMLKIANVRSAMIYANSHVGYCYWPTKVGHMHRGIKRRDIMGETLFLCHKEGMDVILYYSLIFNNWAHEKYPQWRIVNIEGNHSRMKRPGRTARYGVCCPNSYEYRKFVFDQIAEFCRNYDFEGVFFDGTLWPVVCYCANCKKRYKEEVGEDIPTVIDWDDSSWIKFQKKREEWLAEFAAMATNAVKKYKPEVAIQHNSATVPVSWLLGVTELLTEHYDYCSGDFYGGVAEQSFICKLYYNLTPNMPFEFMIYIGYPNPSDHTTAKPKELIECRAFLAIAHNGAFLIIDAIDPIGTQDERKYRMIGSIYREIGEYEKYLGGELCQDLAIYFSFDSKMDFAENGKRVSPEIFGGVAQKLPHVEAALGAAEALRTSHIPFGVVTKRNLKELPRFQVVILPNVSRLSDEEADAIKEYVASGGSVYASKFTLKSKLSEILGVVSMEETREKFTYIAPTLEGKKLLPEINEEYPLSISDSQIKAEFSSRGEVIATITLPYTDPDDPKFASIHSNPPDASTDYPAIICKKFGKGKIVWSSAPIEAYAVQSLKHRSIFNNIIKFLVQNPLSFEAEAPACMEILLFHKPQEKRYLINLVNFQSEIGLPNIPVSNVTLKVKMKGKPLKAASLPDETPVAFKREGDYVSMKVPTIRTFRMLSLDYE